MQHEEQENHFLNSVLNMRTIKLLTLFICISTLGFSQGKADLFDSLFSTMNQRRQFYGNVLIAENSNITFSKCYGYADREKKTLLNEQSLFNIGSVSKAFTAIAILQLVENKKVKLSDYVSKYLPDFPYPDITIHHLLIHAAGLPLDYFPHDSIDKSTIATNNDVLSVLYSKKPPLLFKPGQRSEYSNLGYMILAEVVKASSKVDYKDYLQEKIFGLANMTRTDIYTAKEIKQVENVAKGYVLYPFSGKYVEAINIPEFRSNYTMSGFQGDGNVYSTTTDLFNFYKTLSNNTLIKEASLKLAYQNHISANMQGTPDYGHSYGYGWLILNAPKQIVNRGGELPGYVTNTSWNIPDERLIIYLSNDYLSYTSYQNQLPMAIAGIFYQNKVEIPKMVASVELTKIVITSSTESIIAKINEIKSNPELYLIDLQGLKFLVMKLEQTGNNDKADLIVESFKP